MNGGVHPFKFPTIDIKINFGAPKISGNGLFAFRPAISVQWATGQTSFGLPTLYMAHSTDPNENHPPSNGGDDDDGRASGGVDDGVEYPEFLKPFIEAIKNKLPESWGDGIPNKKKEGWRWENPANSNQGVRIDQGNPSSPYPSQQVDHLAVNDGSLVGQNGQRIPGGYKSDPVNAHVPLSDWLKWTAWNRP